jgi:hypothetical protein
MSEHYNHRRAGRAATRPAMTIGRTIGMKIGMAIMSGLFIAVSSAAIADDTRGSREEQAACRSDTRRFCRTVDPDSGTHGILTCLKQNRSKLSRACRGLLESHGQ